MRALTYVEIDVPEFKDSIKSLLHFDGADGSTTFIDETGKVWTANGDAQIDTAQSKFGGASGLFDGTGDYVDTPDSTDFTLGSNDFTIDAWFQDNASGGAFRFIAGQTTGGFGVEFSFDLGLTSGDVLRLRVGQSAATVSVQGTTQFNNSTNTGWHHVAAVRIGNTLKLFVDGVQEGGDVAISGAVNDSSANLFVGQRGDGSLVWSGWIDEFRLSVGVARWTTNFTPPTLPYTLNETYRFAIPTSYLPLDIPAIPSIDSVNFSPAHLSLGEDLGTRASLTISFRDHPHIMASEPLSQGTFFGKWRGRYGQTLRGAAVRLIRGQVGQTLDEMDTRHYVVERTSGPTLGASYTIEAKDILKLADDDRAQAPAVSTGSLAGSIDTAATAIVLTPSGIGDLEYPSSGYVTLGGKEIVSFTRTGDNMTIVRAQFGTVAQSHSAGDRVQLAIRYTGDTVSDIIYDLLVNYAGISASYIPKTEWDAEVAEFLSVIYARTIADPQSVRKLIVELIEQAALVLWWDDRAELIRLNVLRQIATDTDTFDQDVIIAGSLGVEEQPDKRISQIWTYRSERDPTDSGADKDNFRAIEVDGDSAKEGAYGSAEIKKINAKWIETQAAATRLNSIQLSRFKDPPRRFRFELPNYINVTPVAGYGLSWWGNQDETGVEQTAPIQITQVQIESDRVIVQAEEMFAQDVVVLTNVVFLFATDGGVDTLAVPGTWNDADNTISMFAGGGAGAAGPGENGGKGGGGGAFSQSTNVALTVSPAPSLDYRVGRAAEDTWFGGSTFGTASIAAEAGQNGSGRTGGGQGGQSSNGAGDLRTSGGNGANGGAAGGNRAGGGGGGAAGGPNGSGGNGGGVGSNERGGGGGGGADGGESVTQTAQGSTGVDGGDNRFGFGGGDATIPSGREGGGGKGGNSGQVGGPGGDGEVIWTQTVAPIVSAGPGGGAGGGGAGFGDGGAGGDYGGGGGGGAGGGAGGEGAPGLIILAWRQA